MSSVPIVLAFALASQTFNLPPGLLSAVCWVESNHRSLIHKNDGSEDSIGMCQIHMSTARDMGYEGSKRHLLRPDINAYYAAKYLRLKLDHYLGDPRKAVAAYNAGKHRENKRGLTKNRKYVSKVFKAWSEDR